MITSKELREKWLNFYKERGHVDIGQVSLISEGDTTVLFNVAGMQPVMPYLLGEKHPAGTRLVNIQGCLRTNDIDAIGDKTHLSFFEMMGSWSLGGYWKEERCNWSFELLTKVFGFSKDKLACTVFEGDENAPRDDETARLRTLSGFNPQNVYFLPKSENWWELDRGPCGPDSEMFVINDVPPCGKDCNPSCSCGRFVEVGNDVFMQYERVEKDKYLPLKQKNIDTGWGFERNLAYFNGLDDVYKTDLFIDAIKFLENQSGVKYGANSESTKAFRIIADHIRTATMLIGDPVGCLPSNTAQGYILRRLIRRAIRYAKKLNLKEGWITKVSNIYINGPYEEAYPMLREKKEKILCELEKEEEKFNKTLEAGLREFNKLIENLTKFAPDNKKISGDKAFRLYDTFGFPIELTEELAAESGFVVDTEGYKEAFKRHQEKSNAVSAGTFKGGLADAGKETAKLHTATHILLAGLRKMFGEDVFQKGSNITPERLRFDFNLDRKMTEGELSELEGFVNDVIKKAIPMVCREMPYEEAKEKGALGVFTSKYGDVVKVYEIEDVSIELCGGPHASNTKELGRFKIVKEESSSSGVRRIKAVLE